MAHRRKNNCGANYNTTLKLVTNAVNIQDGFLLRRAIHKKDREALGRLNTIYYPRIKRYIASYINLTEDVEDLAQSVFLELCKDDGSYKVCLNAEAYLLGIAKNLITLYYRSQNKQIKTIPINSMDEIAADVQSTRLEQFSQQKCRELKGIIARLPPKTKEAISLRLIDGFSIQQAANLAGCSMHTFCQRIYQAKKTIETLRPRFYDED